MECVSAGTSFKIEDRWTVVRFTAPCFIERGSERWRKLNTCEYKNSEMHCAVSHAFLYNWTCFLLQRNWFIITVSTKQLLGILWKFLVFFTPRILLKAKYRSNQVLGRWMAKSGPGIKPPNNQAGSPSVSTHNILLPEQELRRSEGCNFQCGVLPGRKKLVFFYTRETGLAAKIYPGYQVSIDHIKVCGGVV